MSYLAQKEYVKYECTCGSLKTISNLYFCRHCLELRCGYCLCHEVSDRSTPLILFILFLLVVTILCIYKGYLLPIPLNTVSNFVIRGVLLTYIILALF